MIDMTQLAQALVAGTGSGLRRRMARIVCMVANNPGSSFIGVLLQLQLAGCRARQQLRLRPALPPTIAHAVPISNQAAGSGTGCGGGAKPPTTITPRSSPA